ncbi:hypothetical protein DRO54_09600 [Candidatus Bathyarchaeota archaeon]|nr:MAG: hypothetical protein DRO54_09600 [Candidatus Bathyarchaeota archaeon]
MVETSFAMDIVYAGTIFNAAIAFETRLDLNSTKLWNWFKPWRNGFNIYMILLWHSCSPDLFISLLGIEKNFQYSRFNLITPMLNKKEV